MNAVGNIRKRQRKINSSGGLAYSIVLKNIYPDRKLNCALLWTDGPRMMMLDLDEGRAMS